jgi:hypothetical protein
MRKKSVPFKNTVVRTTCIDNIIEDAFDDWSAALYMKKFEKSGLEAQPCHEDLF